MSLTDAQWARIEPLLQDRTPRRGGRWRDHRQVIDAIAFKYSTGTPWTDLPERFGSWKGAHNRLRRWAADGTWEKVFTALLAGADAGGDLDGAAVVGPGGPDGEHVVQPRDRLAVGEPAHLDIGGQACWPGAVRLRGAAACGAHTSRRRGLATRRNV
ncbi:transposase [Streptomyces olivaceoviridis]|uniref:transposase n=1 Tax=Streptomyces olivaceoviridis TaxID=1921 RepID=UPI0036B30EEE